MVASLDIFFVLNAGSSSTFQRRMQSYVKNKKLSDHKYIIFAIGNKAAEGIKKREHMAKRHELPKGQNASCKDHRKHNRA